MSTTAPIVAAAAAAAVVGYSLYCWRALSLERQSIEAARKELARAQSNNTSAPVLPQPGGSAQPRSWKSHLTGLDKMISELLVEARLLASELNKGGDPMAVVLDPLAATATAERRFMSAADAAVKQSSNSSASGAPAQPPVLKRAESMTINTTIQQLGSFEPGQLPTKVVGVCGMSCCGKSTVTATLRAAAHERGSYVPVICLDDSYHDWMDDEPSREHPTNYHPPGGSNRRAWKNWESRQCIDWQQFLDKLQAKIEIHKGYTPFIIIEGFLLLEDDTAAAMCDHVVSIDIPKEIAWQRRLARALQMAAGEQDASGMDNYERLPVYAVPEDFEAIGEDAAKLVTRLGKKRVFPRADEALEPGESDLSKAAGSYDWLRLYFEEVIWPEATRVQETVQRRHRSGEADVHTVRGDVKPAEVERATRAVIARALF